jgi:hypothetical protein
VHNKVLRWSSASGLWVPDETRREITLANTNGSWGEYLYKVKGLSQNVVTANDLRVELSLGVRISDGVSKTIYVTERDGKVNGGFYYDAGTGNVFAPDGSLMVRPSTMPPTQAAPGLALRSE